MNNEFKDINKFPKGWGMIVFPISMSRIGNALSSQSCIDALHMFGNKVNETKVGVHFLYTEGLYMNFEQDAYETKNKFATSALSHKRAVQNLVFKNNKEFQIESAFSFESWFQMYLSHKDFFGACKKVREFYESDPVFQRYIAEDAASSGRELNERQISFFIEEHTFAYLLLNRQIHIQNEFVNNKEEWVLIAYPGHPCRSQIYLYQKDILGLNKNKNPYKGQYDLSSNRFIDYEKFDLTNATSFTSRSI